jgi:hypothetical protein
MALAVVAVTVAQLLDLATFTRMVSVHGPAVEGNPLVAFLLTDMGLPFVAVAKIAALSVIVGVITVLAGRDGGERHPRVAAIVALVAVVAGLVGGWTNVTVIV